MSSLRWNPMTLPILALFGVTLFQILERGSASRAIGRAWIALLVLAWIIKLASPTDTW